MNGTSPTKELHMSPSTDVDPSEESFQRPRGLKAIYYHPITQLIMLGFVCFLCPGMFNALTGLGGGGQMNATTSANSTCAVYATYAFFAFFSGYSFMSLELARNLTFCHSKHGKQQDWCKVDALFGHVWLCTLCGLVSVHTPRHNHQGPTVMLTLLSLGLLTSIRM